MKYTILLAIIFNSLIACGNGENKSKTLKDSTKINQPAIDTILYKDKESNLFEKADNIRKMLGSKDKNKVKQVFTFPIAVAAFGSLGEYSFFSEDPAYPNFSKDIKNANGMITEEIFLKYFDKISKNLKLNLLSEIPANIKTDTIRSGQGLHYTWGNNGKNQPCIKFYMLDHYKEDNLIFLQYGYEQNPSFINKTNDDSKDCHVPTNGFQFKIDGEKLIFSSESTAG